MDRVKLLIDFAARPEPYDRMIFGIFLEHFHRQVYGSIFDPGNQLANKEGFRTDVITALQELKIPIVRWPGGCFVSAYHWINGVGKNRTPSWDKAWHVEDPNTFGTDDFISWCKQIGAEPYICTNAGTGTPEEMSDWVEYCNLKTEGRFAQMRISNGFRDPHHVKYWSVGNENWGSHEMGAKTIEEWRYFVKESAKLIVNVDPTVKISAAATPDRKWTLPLLKTAGKWLDMISIHGYWDPLWQKDTPADYLTCMLKTEDPEHQIQQTIQLIKNAHLEDRIQIAFDEWNLRGWHHPGFGMRFTSEMIPKRDRNDLNATYTMADALFSACFFNSCLRNAKYVKMACLAPGINVRGPIFVHPEGIVKRTTFHVLKMYSMGLQPFVMSSKIQSKVKLKKKTKAVAMVDGIVTCSEDRQIFTIMLVNKHPDKVINVQLNFPTEIDAIVLDADSVDAYNDISQPDRVVPKNSTPHALVVIFF